MTNNEILNASMLDIIFNNRNKDYGAYVLRREYPYRLLMALIATFVLVFLVFLLSSFTNKKNPTIKNPAEDYKVIVRSVDFPKELPNLPEKHILLPKHSKPSASVAYTSRIKIEKDDLLKKTDVPDVNDFFEKEIATENIDGPKKEGIVNSSITFPDYNDSGVLFKKPAPEKETIFSRSDAVFPGGHEALMRFFKRNLNTPGELSEGEKKMVQVRFKIDKEGEISSLEIYKSGGELFDKEVIRVCRKMPRWKPAMQNGIKVPVSFVIPVTFIAMEQ